MVGLLQERRGPLPVWAWAVLALGVLLLLLWWRQSRKVTAPEGDVIVPGDQTPPPVIQIQLPPGAPTTPTTPGIPPTTTPPTVPPGGGRDNPPGSGPGVTVTVTRFTTPNPPWSSTISGIFGHYRASTTARSWQELWTHPQNASLRALRSAPERIRPGDRVFVPGARS